MRKILSYLRKNHPLDGPVRIRYRPLDRDFGFISKGRTHYNITLDSNQTKSVLHDTLIHEWAHALTWDDAGNDHNAHWGVTYALITRGWLKANGTKTDTD